MKRQGFTLVELLAVIVILALIALITVPLILGVIEKSRRGALQNSGYGLVEAGTLYNAQYQNAGTVRFDIKDNEVDSEEENKLTYKGNIKEGTVLINNKGKVVVCINDGKYAAYKNFEDTKVTIVDNKACTVPENSNIVYLDNEATIDTNINDLIVRIESLESTVKDQKEEIEKLKLEKASQIEITNQIANLNNTHHIDMATVNGKLGNKDISSIGDGTITDAINIFNEELSYKNPIYSTHVNEPWYAVKENWEKLKIGLNYGKINGGMEFGYIFNKTESGYGAGIIFGYYSGAIWHIYVSNGSYLLENVTIQELRNF